MSAGGIGKMDPEETDAAPEDDEPYWNYGFAGGYTGAMVGDDAYYNSKPSPVDYGGDLGMLGDSDLNTLAVPVRDQISPVNRPFRDVLMTSELPPQLSPALDSGYQSTSHVNHVGGQQQIQYNMHHQQQQQPMQASGMQHIQPQQQQTVHVHQHIPQPGSSQPQQPQHVLQHQSGPQQIFVQQQANSVPSSNVQLNYMSNGTTWTTVPGQQQVHQIPQQAVLVQSVQSMNQLNGSTQYVILNSQTSCANIVASGAPLVQPRSVAIASMSGSGPNVTTMSGQPVVSSQTISSDNSVFPQDQQQQQIIVQSGPGCMTIPGSLPNGRIVQMTAPMNSQPVQQNQRVIQPLIQTTTTSNLQQLLSSVPSTSHTPVAPAPAPVPQQPTPAPAATKPKRPLRRKPAGSTTAPKKQPEPAVPSGSVMTARMEASDSIELANLLSQIAQLEQVKGEDVSEQMQNLLNRRNAILMKLVSATPNASVSPSPATPIQPQQQSFQSQSQSSTRQQKRAQSQTPQRPPAIRDPTPQNVYDPMCDNKSQLQLIHSSQPSTSFEASQQQNHVFAQSQSSNFSSSNTTTVLQSVQYASTSQISSQQGYQQPVMAQSVEVVRSSHLYATSNVVSALTSQPGGGPVASCIITQQQQKQNLQEQQRLIAPKPAANTPIKLSTATTPQQPRVSPAPAAPVIKLPTMHELSFRIQQRKDFRTKELAKHFEHLRDIMDDSEKLNVNTPFRGISDSYRRLIPFATYYEPDLAEATLEKFDHEHMRLSVYQASRKRKIEERLAALHLKEAKNPIDSDLQLLYSLDREYERRKLDEEKELAKTSPEAFASTSEFIPFSCQIKETLEKMKETLKTDDALQNFKFSQTYEYCEITEDRFKHNVSADELMSDAELDDQRSVRAFQRKRSKPNFDDMRLAYLRDIADEYTASIQPPYSFFESSVFDDPSTPGYVRKNRPPSVIMSPPSVDKKHLTILSPAAQSRLTTPQRQATPQPVQFQPPPPPQPQLQQTQPQQKPVPQPVQPVQPPAQPQPVPQPPVVPKIVIQTPSAPSPVPVPPKVENKHNILDLKTRNKRFRMPDPEPVNNENINSEKMVPPMKISRFHGDSLATTSVTPASIAKPEQCAPQAKCKLEVQQNDRKVQPLKFGIKVPSLKISLKRPDASSTPVENGTSHPEMEELSGKKKRKDKDKKKKHKERDKEKRKDKDRELDKHKENKEKEREIIKQQKILKQQEVLKQQEMLMQQKMLRQQEAMKQQEMMMQEMLKQKEMLRQQEAMKQQEMMKYQEMRKLLDQKDKERDLEKVNEPEKEKIKEKEKEKVKDKDKEKSKDKERNKESKKDKKKKKKHRSEENQANAQIPQTNGVIDSLPSTSVIVKPPVATETPKASFAPPLKIKFKQFPPGNLSTPAPEQHPKPPSADSSTERPNGLVPLRIRISKMQSAESTSKASEVAQPIVSAPPPAPPPQPQPQLTEQQMAKSEKKKEKKEKKKKEKEGGVLKLKIKRLVPPSDKSTVDCTTPTAAPTSSSSHRKEKDRSSKKEKSSKKHEASSQQPSSSSVVQNCAPVVPPLAARTSSADQHSSPFLAQEPPAVEQSIPPLRIKVQKQQAPPIPPMPASVFPATALNIDQAAAAASYSINSMFINTLTAFKQQKGSFSPNCSDEEPESDLRHRTDDLISRLTSNPKACAQNSS